MKTIWTLCHYAEPPELGGMNRHHRFAKNLIMRGYQVRIFAASTIHNTKMNVVADGNLYQQQSYDGVPYVHIRTSSYEGNGKKRILNMLQFAWRVYKTGRMMEGQKPDVVLASSAHPFTWISGYFLARTYKARFIAETRDLWPESLVEMGACKRNGLPAKVLYGLESFIFRKADHLIFTMPGGLDYAKKKGVQAKKVSCINNGIDLEEFDRLAEQEVHENEFNGNSDKFRVIYTGSIGHAHAVHYLVQAAKVIQKKRYDNIQIDIYGEGMEKDALQEWACKEGVTNVCFKGRVDKKFIPGILLKSDLNIATGQDIQLYQYGLSMNKFFDYFASGKPTLSNVACKYDILEHYHAGITVKPGSPEALAEGILQFYHMEQEEYNHYCENARKAAVNFDFKNLTDELEKTFL
ncbi:Glycosyltransferase involved in cell wall bisynthesis [Tindallia magadiensis]|uniref:Glycosyltransferase involved in cell wall bisynthesis n=1 Tax=Tindallia magadiensis TaxID=69895 RepID=A0A1I3D422_9FIRM|nr:glycosyltransferase family 4 protein [Tindallia magadiensis]SFH81524.1 Glycosyltransferase involved in cell wall bisynthesis [Tindallia magadiensis]